jgi:N utilization substance protein B
VTKQDARERALGLLYAGDVGADTDPPKPTGRAGRLAVGVLDHLSEIDEIIESHSTGWRLSRMPAVDRAILRMGVYELCYTDTPVGVVVSEAVELAKRYSTAKSGSFVNAVLANVAADAEASPGSAIP